MYDLYADMYHCATRCFRLALHFYRVSPCSAPLVVGIYHAIVRLNCSAAAHQAGTEANGRAKLEPTAIWQAENFTLSSKAL